MEDSTGRWSAKLTGSGSIVDRLAVDLACSKCLLVGRSDTNRARNRQPSNNDVIESRQSVGLRTNLANRPCRWVKP